MSPAGATLLFWQSEVKLMSAALMLNSGSLAVTTINDSLCLCAPSLPSSTSSVGAAAQRGHTSSSTISCPLPHLPHENSTLVMRNCPFSCSVKYVYRFLWPKFSYYSSSVKASPSPLNSLGSLASYIQALRCFVFEHWCKITHRCPFRLQPQQKTRQSRQTRWGTLFSLLSASTNWAKILSNGKCMFGPLSTSHLTALRTFYVWLGHI